MTALGHNQILKKTEQLICDAIITVRKIIKATSSNTFHLETINGAHFLDQSGDSFSKMKFFSAFDIQVRRWRQKTESLDTFSGNLETHGAFFQTFIPYWSMTWKFGPRKKKFIKIGLRVPELSAENWHVLWQPRLILHVFPVLSIAQQWNFTIFCR